jgi:hypothetical protein
LDVRQLIIEAADVALYEAKGAGKNRAVAREHLTATPRPN